MLAWLLLLAVQSESVAVPRPFDRVVPIECDGDDRTLEGHGLAQRVEYTSEFSGTLVAWVVGDDSFDTFLRIEDADGRLLAEDDDSGGKPVGYAKLSVEPGAKFLITAAAAHAGSTPWKGTLHLVGEPETQGTREEAASANAECEAIESLRKQKRLDEARARAQALVERITNVPGGMESDLIAAAAWAAGFQTYALGQAVPTEKAWGFSLRCREGRRPQDLPGLLKVRKNAAVALSDIGRLPEAIVLQERVLESCERTRPADDTELVSARENLAISLMESSQYTRAREFLESVVASRQRTLPEGDPLLLTARNNLSTVLVHMKDYAGASALQEPLLAEYERTLPADDPDIQMCRVNLAASLKAQGRFQAARTLLERALEVRERTLPKDSTQLQNTRANLANVLAALGDHAGALALQREVLASRERTLPEDHAYVQLARENLGKLYSRMGEYEAALALKNSVLASRERLLPEGHGDLDDVRYDVATTLIHLQRTSEALPILERVLAAWEASLPEDHDLVLSARAALASCCADAGELERSREIQERVLAVRSRQSSVNPEDMLLARLNVAAVIALEAKLRSGRARRPGDPSLEDERRAFFVHVEGALHSLQLGLRDALTGTSPREAEERVANQHDDLDHFLSFACGYGVFDPEPDLVAKAWLLHESGRSAAETVAQLVRKAASDPEVLALRSRVRELSRDVVVESKSGTDREELDSKRRALEATSRELALRAGLSSGSAAGTDPELSDLASRLGPREALVSWRRTRRTFVRPVDGATETSKRQVTTAIQDLLYAFVLRRGAPDEGAPGVEPPVHFQLCDLGEFAPVEAAVEAWRAGLVGQGERGLASGVDTEAAPVGDGAALARLVLEPLRSELEGVDRITIAVDDVLHLIPFDALPAGSFAQPGADATKLLGDVVRVDIHSNLLEILGSPEAHVGDSLLAAIGGATFSEAPLDSPEEVPESAATRTSSVSREAADAGILRGTSAEAGFSALPATAEEVSAIAAGLQALDPRGTRTVVLEGRRASRAAFERLAPSARWLHVATHGWYAPDSQRSIDDSDTGRSAAQSVMPAAAQNRLEGLSPLVLCGLAFAGANLPQDSLGRIPGLITAQEIAALDLSNCELAVLSACETHSGRLSRAGQGVASLQRALHMAGASSVITSLWSVPDDATRELMVEFYRLLWNEKKPKSTALWEAKQILRSARDSAGNTKYSARDWAAWVLTGDPN